MYPNENSRIQQRNDETGTGDVHFSKESTSIDGYWKNKRFGKNGMRIPVWVDGPKTSKKMKSSQIQSPTEGQKSQNLSLNSNSKLKQPADTTNLPITTTPNNTTRSTSINKNSNSILNIAKCPICLDTIIEATTSSCGHTFCHQCIYQSINAKSLCPICEASLSNCTFTEPKLHRVYLVDQLIETQISNLSKDVEERIEHRREIRLEKARQQWIHRNSWWNSIQYLLTGLRISFQSKGFFAGIGHFLKYIGRRIRSIPVPSRLWIVILLSCATMILIWSSCNISVVHFIKYLWEVIINYPGFPKPIIIIKKIEQPKFHIFDWLITMIKRPFS